MKILALDVSTKSTGWFITKRSCGIVSPPAALGFEDKMVYFRQELLKLLQKYKPDLVVLEDVYYRPGLGSIHTVKALSKFGGVAAEVSRSVGCEVKILTATTARKNCCGKQESPFKKREVFEFFKKKYDLEDWTFAKKNDITDAMALSWGYREIQRTEKKGDSKETGK